MDTLKVEELARYLSDLFKKRVKVISFGELGKEKVEKELKGYGYGVPIFIEFELDGEKRSVVLETMSPGPFGHEHFSDRAQSLLWGYSTFNRLPGHVRALDTGFFTKEGIRSAGDAEEFFLLTEFIKGEGYYKDLERLKSQEKPSDIDIKRVRVLSDYLSEIHKMKKEEPQLYVRRIRELVGHGEAIMGLVDSYSPKWEFIDKRVLERIEKKCIGWRWRIKDKVYRLSQVHGDFHPWNILFRERTDFTVLDRARGEWGEPADDVSALTINYIFFSLQRFGKLKDPFERLYLLFWENYLKKSGDEEILKVVQPFYAWRGLVIASPLWYPNLIVEVRRRLFNFINNALSAKVFNIYMVNEYLGV